jgi:hypothetical protein
MPLARARGEVEKEVSRLQKWPRGGQRDRTRRLAHARRIAIKITNSDRGGDSMASGPMTPKQSGLMITGTKMGGIEMQRRKGDGKKVKFIWWRVGRRRIV